MLLLLLGFAAGPAHAQKQTPANVAPSYAWKDGATGLMWTLKDNGTDVDWNQASAYCANLRLGRNSDWRLPTIDELQDIYDHTANVNGYRVEGNLLLSGWHWSSSQKNASGQAWLSTTAGHRSPPLLAAATPYVRYVCAVPENAVGAWDNLALEFFFSSLF
jgi:formylglycine-generating enzyme required for sulfatase activity